MALHHCKYCQNAILTCRIACVECPDFDLCLQCFACGVEAGPHKKEHDYQVFDHGGFGVFDNTNPWGANEEESLLDAVEQFGFGNWEDVAGHVKERSAEDCKDHYYTFFIHGNIGKVTFKNDIANRVTDHTTPDGGPLSPSLTTPLPPMELTLQEQHELGYMPLRDDFEREYDNEAETLVSGLSLNYDDEDIDTAFKLVQVDMYRQRLKERQRRKRIAREYSVIQSSTTVGIKKTQANKKKISKDEKEFQEKMRVFAQFHSHREHEQIFQNIQKEKKIKTRIKELMRYRRNGITKLDESTDFDAERVKREKKKEHKKKTGSSSLTKRMSMVSKKTNLENGDDGGNVIITDDVKPNGKVKDVAAFPGFDLLSRTERKLCHSMSMKPASYITIKTCIIKDYLTRRQGTPVKIRYPSHLDKTHRRKILNFLSENGWIGGVTA